MYNQAFINLNGNGEGDYGIFGNFMNDVGCWTDGMVNPNASESQIANNNDSMITANIFVLGNQTIAQNSLQNVTGTQYDISSCSQSGNCYNYVKQNNSSAYVMTLQSMYESMLLEGKTYVDSATNIIPLYDDYNNSLAALYQQNLTAITEMYQIEFSINQLNALSQGSTQQVASLFGVPQTHFEYNTSLSESQNTNNYNQAQVQLSLYFAALLNQMYSTTLSYIVSDVPFGLQSYPNTTLNYVGANGIDYVESGFTNYAVMSTNSSTPLGQFKSEFNGATNLMLYQYAGINNVNQCINSLISYNQMYGPANNMESVLNPSNCSPVFWDNITNSAYNQAIYDVENTIVPYYFNGNNISLYSQFINNIAQCKTYFASSTANSSSYTSLSDMISLSMPTGIFLACNWAGAGNQWILEEQSYVDNDVKGYAYHLDDFTGCINSSTINSGSGYSLTNDMAYRFLSPDIACFYSNNHSTSQSAGFSMDVSLQNDPTLSINFSGTILNGSGSDLTLPSVSVGNSNSFTPGLYCVQISEGGLNCVAMSSGNSYNIYVQYSTTDQGLATNYTWYIQPNNY